MQKLWEGWKKIAKKIGDFQAKLIFSLLYYILVVPIGLVARLFADFLGVGKFMGWKDSEIRNNDIDSLKEQD